MVDKTPPSEAQIAAFDRLLATHPEIERKGKNLLYTSVNGHMFTMFSTEARFGLRLSRADQARFTEQYESGPFTSYGSTMKDYVVVPEDLLEQTEELAPWLAASFEYVCSLEPKTSAKARPKAKATAKAKAAAKAKAEPKPKARPKPKA